MKVICYYWCIEKYKSGFELEIGWNLNFIYSTILFNDQITWWSWISLYIIWVRLCTFDSVNYLMREEFFWDCGYWEVKLIFVLSIYFIFLAVRNIWSSIYYNLSRSKFNHCLDRGLRNVCVKSYFNFIEKSNSFMRNEIIFYFLITRQIIFMCAYYYCGDRDNHILFWFIILEARESIMSVPCAYWNLFMICVFVLLNSRSVSGWRV